MTEEKTRLSIPLIESFTCSHLSSPSAVHSNRRIEEGAYSRPHHPFSHLPPGEELRSNPMKNHLLQIHCVSAVIEGKSRVGLLFIYPKQGQYWMVSAHKSLHWRIKATLKTGRQMRKSWSLLHYRVLFWVLFMLLLRNVIRQHDINLPCYADDTQLYLSMEPDETNRLVRLQACLKDMKSWMTELSASKFRQNWSCCLWTWVF